VLHPDGRRLVLVGVWASAPTQFRIGATVRLNATAFQHLEQEGQPRVIGGEIRVKDLPLVEQVLWIEGMRSTLSLPLRQEGPTVGILLFSSQSENVMSSHLLLFETIGLVFEETLVQLGRARLEEQLRAESPTSD
jgi:GAF domain-containing protein